MLTFPPVTGTHTQSRAPVREAAHGLGELPHHREVR
jgi:hypothetical protein